MLFNSKQNFFLSIHSQRLYDSRYKVISCERVLPSDAIKDIHKKTIRFQSEALLVNLFIAFLQRII